MGKLNEFTVTIPDFPDVWPGATGDPTASQREAEALVERVTNRFRDTLLASLRRDFAEGMPFTTTRHVVTLGSEG